MASPARTPSRRQVSFSQFLALVMAFLLLCGIGGVAGAGLLVPMAAGANVATDSVVEIFDELPDELQPDRPSEMSYVYFSDDTLMAKIYAQNRVVKPLDQIAPILQRAVIDVEDKRFYEHGAVDFEGITRAAVRGLNGKQEGASTLTQQYVKNVLIDKAVRENDPIASYEAAENSLARKAREAKLAIALEERMSKDDILAGYLNIAQFGRSVYGVEAAAQQYFGVSAADVNYLQAATIAGITKEPKRYDPSKPENQADAEARRNVVLKLMLQQGDITQEEYDTGKATPITATLNVQEPKVGCEAAGGAAVFCSYVLKYITENPAFGETAEERTNMLYTGGLQIQTSLDPTMQASAEAHAAAAVPATDPTGLGDAIVSVEPGTGFIRAMAQNKPYSPNAEVPGSTAPEGSTSLNLATDQAHGGSAGFSPGSTWKAFTLAEWLKSGHTLSQTVDANKRPFVLGQSFHGSCVGNFGKEVWNPSNSDGSTDAGNITVARATAFSVNTAYASMETQLDLCSLRDTAWSIGLRPARSSEIVLGSDGQPSSESIKVFPSMTIGTQTASPLQMAASYATFASGGTYCEPMPIESVTTTQGDVIPMSTTCNPNALPANVANTVTYALEGVLNGGGANGKGLAGRPSAGKTGTANNNYHTWFIGYTPQLVSAVWIGNIKTDSLPMHNISIAGKRYGYIYGTTIAAPTWQSYMNQILEGAPVEQFPGPDPALVSGGGGGGTSTPTPGGDTGRQGGNGGGQNGGGQQGGQQDGSQQNDGGGEG